MRKISNIKIFFLVATFFVLAVSIVGCRIFDNRMRDSQTAEAERIIKENPEYREVDDLCKQIPVPTESTFIGKARLFRSVGLLNYYYSETESNLLWKEFEKFFNKDGWQQIKSDSINPTLEVRKQNYEVSIQFGGIGRGISYSIFCGKISTIEQKNR